MSAEATAAVCGRPRPRRPLCAPVAVVALTAGIAVLGQGCAGPPWYLGEPLGGRPAIPPTSQAKTVAERRAEADAARAAGDLVAEIAALDALEQRGTLRSYEEKRLVELLARRVRDWAALGRPIPLAADLRHIVALQPARALPLAHRLRNAELAAGDLWLGLGENSRAEAEYRDAEKLGADSMDVRFRAVWGASVADLDDAALQRALAQLPERVLAPFTVQYLARAGGEPRLLHRAWSAARIYGPPALRARLEALPDAAAFTTDVRSALATDRAVTATPPAPPAEPASGDLLSSGPTVARALLPLAAAFPQLLAPGPRSRLWAERLVAEDPTSPDSLEVAALIDARAGRMGGAEQKLGDLVFFSLDRAAGYERAAHVWETVDDMRRACAAWERATRVGAADDPRWCDLLACARRDPGGADPEAITSFLRDRAPRLACLAPASGQEPPPTASPESGGANPPGVEPPPSAL